MVPLPTAPGMRHTPQTVQNLLITFIQLNIPFSCMFSSSGSSPMGTRHWTPMAKAPAIPRQWDPETSRAQVCGTLHNWWLAPAALKLRNVQRVTFCRQLVDPPQVMGVTLMGNIPRASRTARREPGGGGLIELSQAKVLMGHLGDLRFLTGSGKGT